MKIKLNDEEIEQITTMLEVLIKHISTEDDKGKSMPNAYPSLTVCSFNGCNFKKYNNEKCLEFIDKVVKMVYKNHKTEIFQIESESFDNKFKGH